MLDKFARFCWDKNKTQKVGGIQFSARVKMRKRHSTLKNKSLLAEAAKAAKCFTGCSQPNSLCWWHTLALKRKKLGQVQLQRFKPPTNHKPTIGSWVPLQLATYGTCNWFRFAGCMCAAMWPSKCFFVLLEEKRLCLWLQCDIKLILQR